MMKKLILSALSILLVGLLLNSCKKDVPSVKNTTSNATVSTIAYGNFQYITVDKSGNIYALKLRYPADTIYKFTQAGVKSIFFIPPVVMNNDTVVTQIMNCLTTDSLGNIYTVLYSGSSFKPNVIKISPDGSSTVIYSNINAISQFQYSKIAFDSAGNFYYDDNGAVYKISTGGTTTMVLTHPFTGIFTPDVYRNIYYEDNQMELQKITPSGAIATVVPTAKLAGYGDIGDLGGDVFGNLYISALSQNNLSSISRLKPNDSLKTVISTPQGYADGPLSTAKIFFPLSLVTDAKGNLYFIDSGDIRKITF